MSSISTRPHPTKGRALHATKPFKAGQVIAAFTPLLLLPTLSHLTTVCTYCLKASSPRPCSRCRAAYYCDARCQAAAWSAGHDKECAALVVNVPSSKRRRQIPTPVRALVQILLSSASGNDLAAAVDGLEGHASQRRKTEGWADLEMMAMGACAFSGRGTREDVVRRAVDILCKIQTNAFHRFDADLGQVGIFLEPTLAMANHSCVPNAMVQFVGRKAILRAETDIKQDDEVEISYTDYTNPLSMRKQALAPYSFDCQCCRCKNDLTVYQVCASSPNIELNQYSLASDTQKLRHHPAVKSSNKTAVARSQGEEAMATTDAQALPKELPERKAVLRSQLAACRNLIAEDLSAVSPLPQALTELSIYYAEEGDYISALAVASFVASRCDPFRFVAPFHPVRAKNLFMMVKLLSNTAADTASSSTSVKSSKSSATVGDQIRNALQDIDQVSLSQMLLYMVLDSAPAAYAAEWELTILAKEIMDGINSLQGREKEQSLIDAWRKNPSEDRNKAFFEYAVVQQVDILAELGRKAISEFS